MITRHLTLCILILFATSLLLSKPQVASAQTAMSSVSILLSEAAIFSPPLGSSNGIKYGPRYTYDNGGTLIENTDYSVTNPDLSHYSYCFANEMRYLLHAGEDWYRLDGSAANGDEVTAVADGTVYDYDTRWSYPGFAVVLEHVLPSGLHVFSVYMHIENVPSEIANGRPVSRGQRIGTVLQQLYDGRYPQYHNTNDSHLHFEMRYFASAASIYSDHPACNIGDAAGRGYTYPGYPPDTYPNSSQHYTDPTTFVKSRAGEFLPLIIKQEPTCLAGQQLLTNGGFESGSVSWVELKQPGYAIITNQLPTPAYSGSWAAWFGGRNNATERIYQEFNVVSGMTGANLSYYIWIGTDETTPGAYDKMYVRLRDSNDYIIQQLDYLNDNSLEHTWLYRSTSLPNLSSRIGQTLRLSFDGTTDGSFITSFLIDNASLTAVCSGLKSSQPSEQLGIPTIQPQVIGGGAESTKPPAPTPTQSPYP